MKRFMSGLIAGALFCCFSAKADEVLFDGNKGKITNTHVTADPQKKDNLAAKYAVAPGKPAGITLGGKDCSQYKALSFRMYSAEADGHGIMLILNSENKKTKGGDYYYKKIKIDWTGWKTIVIPFNGFEKNRSPLGWNHIDSINFNFSGWGLSVNPKGKYYFDDIKFLSSIQKGSKTPVKKK